MLMSILMPALQRVRKQARAVACQANLRQWGLLYATYTSENDGYLPPRDLVHKADAADPWWASWRWLGGMKPASDAATAAANIAAMSVVQDILCCPMATQFANPRDLGAGRGGTFAAWGWWAVPGEVWSSWKGSYGTPEYARSYWDNQYPENRPYYWMTNAVKNAAEAPVFLDSALPWAGWANEKASPPDCDALPTFPAHNNGPTTTCMNRHDGGINGLFLDGSVRKVGLKELWTVRWWPGFDTRGPWTTRGGVTPDAWPPWMRRLKDY
jgi:prepilin-type processing-associated H-X9-DG protein